jgi:hypothetical protein
MSSQYCGEAQKGTGLSNEETDACILKTYEKIAHPLHLINGNKTDHHTRNQYSTFNEEISHKKHSAAKPQANASREIREQSRGWRG